MTLERTDDDATIDEIVDRLTIRFPSLETGTIRDVVATAYAELSDAHVRDFVPVLVEKKAKKALKAL